MRRRVKSDVKAGIEAILQRQRYSRITATLQKQCHFHALSKNCTRRRARLGLFFLTGTQTFALSTVDHHSTHNMSDTDQPLSDYHLSNTVFLLVGPEQEQILVHAPYLAARSDFFRAAVSKKWKEGQSRVIKLPEDDPEVVVSYLDFAYNDRLPTMQQRCTPELTAEMYLALAKLNV